MMMEEDSKKWLYYGIPVVVVIGIGAALYYGRTHRQAEQKPPVAQTETAPPATAPQIQHPLEEETSAAALPSLAESDPPVQEALSGLFSHALDPFLVPQNIIRHTVVTIDNLPRKKTAVQMWPVKPIGGELATTGPAEQVTLGDANYQRYEPFIKILQSTDTTQLVAMYKRFYPLFQQSYVELGYPDGYFNDRVVEVIDHLLATPDVPGPIRLTRPSVYYEFADAELENRSAGQKLLIRMGSKNAAAVKAKLRELRQAVAK
jgi:hypothetical protein